MESRRNGSDIAHPTREKGSVALEAVDIHKRYGGLVAVDNARISVCYGEIVALVGDNGAGKSTLAKVLSGTEVPERGTLRVNGRKVEFKGPRDAENAGVHTVYQDLALCNNLDAVSNLYLGHELRTPWYWGWSVDHVTMASRTKALVRQLGGVVRDVHTPVGNLSGGQRQALAISRAILHQAQVVILDEPTNNLGVTQRGRVIELMHTLRASARAILLISHDLGEVQEIADRVFVMRLGRTAAELRRGEYSTDRLIGLMTGAIASGEQAPAEQESA